MSIFLYIKNKALHLYNKVKQVKPIDNDNGNGDGKKTNSVQAQRIAASVIMWNVS